MSRAFPLVKGLPFGQGQKPFVKVCLLARLELPFVKASFSLRDRVFDKPLSEKRAVENKHCFKLQNMHLGGYANKQEII